MNILIVCGEYFNQSNGLSLSTQRFVEQFKRLGDEVRVLSSDRGGRSEYSVPVMHVPFVDGIMDQQNYHYAKPDRQVILETLSWAELVHFEDPFPLSVETAKLAAQMGLPITGTFHLYPENMTASVPIFDFPLSNRNILNVFRWGVFQYCSAIQCPTEKVKERLAKSGYRSKLCVISNGIPSEIIADYPGTKHNDRFTIISVGRYSNEKDQMTLMKAVRTCRHSADIQLILAGKGPLEDKYQAFGRTLPNPPIMRFYAQEELLQEIRRADLYVHCANVEIEGMGCMEAFAQGTVPLIANSELSSTAAYALTKRNRYEAGDAEELAEKIDYWFEHREELSAMGQRYIDLARTLTIEESAKKVRQMMLEAIQEKRQSAPQEKKNLTEKEKMLAGQLYDPSDEELTALRLKARKLARRYNQTDEDKHEKQQELLRELLPNSAEIPGLQAPVYFDYGCNTTFGKFSGANFNFTCLDVCPVHIGDNVLIGPNVTLATPMHPLLPAERNVRQDKNGRYYNLEYAKPITIEDNCWLASNVVVCGGVTIGEGSVIGAGSVVTRDIPPHSLAVGNPCRVVRTLSDADRMKG